MLVRWCCRSYPVEGSAQNRTDSYRKVRETLFDTGDSRGILSPWPSLTVSCRYLCCRVFHGCIASVRSLRETWSRKPHLHDEGLGYSAETQHSRGESLREHAFFLSHFIRWYRYVAREGWCYRDIHEIRKYERKWSCVLERFGGERICEV